MTVAEIKNDKNLTFRQAWFKMLCGYKVKRPSWSGYWAFEDGTIKLHIRDGETIDIRQTENVPYTFSNIVENDWMVVKD